MTECACSIEHARFIIHYEEETTMKRAFASYCVVGGLLLSLAGCNTMESSDGKMTTDKSLYDRLG